MELTNITPCWRPIHCIAVPDNGVYKLVKASHCRPNHIEGCPDIPCYQGSQPDFIMMRTQIDLPSKCHAKGIRAKMKPMNAKSEYT